MSDANDKSAHVSHTDGDWADDVKFVSEGASDDVFFGRVGSGKGHEMVAMVLLGL